MCCRHPLLRIECWKAALAPIALGCGSEYTALRKPKLMNTSQFNRQSQGKGSIGANFSALGLTVFFEL